MATARRRKSSRAGRLGPILRVVKALVPIVWFALLGCAAPETVPSDGGGSDANFSDAAASNGATRVTEGGSLTCPSAQGCAAAADCGGVRGCFECLGGCCLPIPMGTDPAGACAGKTACRPVTCDGSGGCGGPSNAPDDTPCGAVCSGVSRLYKGACQKGVCRADKLRITDCAEACFGDYEDCSICPSTGCVAACTPLKNHFDLCLP